MPLKELSKIVEATLVLAMKMGKVVIVTNAMEPWVEASCRNFMPSVMHIVSQIPIIYARSIYDSLVDRTGRKAQASANVRSSSSGLGRAMPGMFPASGQNKLGNYNARLASQAAGDDHPSRWKELAFEQEIVRFYSRYAHQSW